jgi:hypothetical protein
MRNCQDLSLQNFQSDQLGLEPSSPLIRAFQFGFQRVELQRESIKKS